MRRAGPHQRAKEGSVLQLSLLQSAGAATFARRGYLPVHAQRPVPSGTTFGCSDKSGHLMAAPGPGLQVPAAAIDVTGDVGDAAAAIDATVSPAALLERLATG
jgi:hypothetical protein